MTDSSTLHFEPECSICDGTRKTSGQPCVCTFASQVHPNMARRSIPTARPVSAAEQLSDNVTTALDSPVETLAWALMAPNGNIIIWSRVRSIVERHELRYPSAKLIPIISAAGCAGGHLSPAALDVLAERERQIDSEGWTPRHDDEYHTGSLARAAAVYALVGSSDVRTPGDELIPSITERLWPWGWNWFKPKSRRHNLIRAGALILAEIERIDRAAIAATGLAQS